MGGDSVATVDPRDTAGEFGSGGGGGSGCGWEKTSRTNVLKTLLPSAPKLITVPLVALTFVGSDTQHDRLEERG